MKKVIFVCLLTLSVCLSQSADQQSPVNATKTPPALNGIDTKPAGKDESPSQPITSTTQPTNPATKKETDPNNKTPGQSPVPATGDKNVTTTATPADVTTKNETNSTTIAPDSSKTTTTTTIKPDEHNGTTTSEVPSPKPTASTPKTVVTSTMQPPTLQARGFDGASFVGGIILTLGLIAIGFMGLKYYRAQTERNYHTL